ncbi:MAG: ParA family protein [Myxococcales bacterium]|nr:ParA family protein [Myxococcales bacterium]
MIIAFHNTKGGVGSTTLAAHTCMRATARGLRVVAVSCDPRQDLRRWLAPSKIPIADGRTVENDSFDADLVVADIAAPAELPAFSPTIWVLPICDRSSWEAACDLSLRLRGSIVWVVNRESLTRYPVPAALRSVVCVAPAIPLSDAIAAAEWTLASVWSDPSTASSRGALAMRSFVDDLLAEAGLLPREELAPRPARARALGAPSAPLTSPTK